MAPNLKFKFSDFTYKEAWSSPLLLLLLHLPLPPSEICVLTVLSYVVGVKLLKDVVVEGDDVNDESVLDADAKAKEGTLKD
ncbi:hypothetical protein E3N88_29135 [Mikania micrantha]|uniref:Uncharacterized protein n=1 Tax=Mikania micrantha TaxID=192012 RepID=A0A5N6N366_9ASTR|nr:hypothetical protein E3N88_29135 [Mikania micrantha]